jgi:hypothetical protein
VPGDADGVAAKVAQPGARARVVEAKTPDVRIKVQSDQGIRPFLHSSQIGHQLFFAI